jgi:hypothetical protein
MSELIQPTQYRYSTKFIEGRWHVLIEDNAGTSSRLLTTKATEAKALATVNYMRNIRTMKVTSPAWMESGFEHERTPAGRSSMAAAASHRASRAPISPCLVMRPV